MTLLSVHDLTVRAGSVSLVKNISFTIEKGEMLALVGESGSGKTLTALSVMGLLPEALQVQFSDFSFQGGGQKSGPFLKGQDMGMIFQEPMTSLNPLHRIGKQIGEAIRIYNRKMPEAKLQERVLELLEKVGLGYFKDRLNAYPHQLSGGERQRVMIAMAIANNPALLIADEPTTALDVTIQAQILELIQELRKRLGMGGAADYP